MSSNRDSKRKSRPQQHVPAKNEKISLYVYDKYAAKYTADQLDLILRRSKASGQQSALAVWILFILFAIFIDFLRINTFVTSQETYQVEAIVDSGLFSNFSTGKFGWPIVLLLFSCVSALLIEGGLTSDNYIHVAAASATLLLLEIGTIVTGLALNTTTGSKNKQATLRWDLFGSLNLAVGCTLCLSWIIWHPIEMILLIHQTKRVHDVVDMNQDKTLLSRQRLHKVSHKSRGTRSSSRRRRKHRHRSEAATAAKPAVSSSKM